MNMNVKAFWKYSKAKMVVKYSSWYAQNNVEEREHIVDVIGMFQYAETHSDGTMDAEPIAIVKLDDGRVVEVPPTALTYIEEEEEDDEVQNCD